jgi:hypothetical protein
MTQLLTAAAALADALLRVLAPGTVVAAADLPHPAGDHDPDLTIVANSVVSLDGAYAVPAAATAATLDLLSPASMTMRGELLLDAKRAELARRGVPLHLEISLQAGALTLWMPREGLLVRSGTGQSFTCEALGNAVIEVPGEGVLRVYGPDGELLTHYDAQAARTARINDLAYDPASEAAAIGGNAAIHLDVTESITLR